MSLPMLIGDGGDDRLRCGGGAVQDGGLRGLLVAAHRAGLPRRGALDLV